jgi:hypothetical protein
MSQEQKGKTPHEHEYQFWESQFLRDSISASVTSISQLERNAVIGAGLAWTWLATHTIINEAQILWFLPVVFSLLGWLRARALLRSIQRTAGYIRELEGYLCVAPAPCGWETHLAQVRRPLVSRTINLFWACLLTVSLVVPFLVMRGLFVR